MRQKEEKEKALLEENKRKQEEREETIRNAQPKEWDCPSCGYINLAVDLKCVVCDAEQSQEEVVVREVVDEDTAAEVDIRKNILTIPISVLIHSIRSVEMMNNYAFEHMDEFVNLTGHGNVDIALSVLCFFKFGKVISLEKHQEDAEYLNDKWEHEFKLSLMSKKKGYELEMKREIEKNSFDDKYGNEEEMEDNEMQMTMEEIKKVQKQRKKEKLLKKKRKKTSQKFKATATTFLNFDPTGSDIICLNLTSFRRMDGYYYDEEDDKEINMKDYLSAMEIWLSYCKNHSHLLIFLHCNQVKEMDGIKVMSWNLVDKVIRDADQFEDDNERVCCYIFRRNEDDDGGAGESMEEEIEEQMLLDLN